MDRYIVISPHTYEECQAVINQFVSAGFATHADFGCMDGEHTAWAIVEADSHDQALLLVPSLMRPKARSIKLMHFDPMAGDPVHNKS